MMSYAATEVDIDPRVYVPAESSERFPLTELLPEDRATLTVQEVGPAKQRIGVGVIDQRVGGVGETIFATLAYQATLDPFELQRYEQVAKEQNARVVIVGTPGMRVPGLDTSPMTKRQKRSLWRGNFKPLGDAMAEAATKAAGLEQGEEVAVLGYSMGDSTAVEMAGKLDAKGAKVKRIRLVEPVTNQGHYATLSWRSKLEESKHQPHFDSIRRYPWLTQPLNRRSDLSGVEQEFEASNWRDDNAIKLGAALTANRLNSQLRRVIAGAQNGLQDAEVTIVNYGDSHMSRTWLTSVRPKL